MMGYSASEHSVLDVCVLEVGRMGIREDLGGFDTGQIVMAQSLRKAIVAEIAEKSSC